MCKLFNFFKPEDPEPEIVPDAKLDAYTVYFGINKYPPELNCDLSGCVGDASDLRAWLIKWCGFEPDHMRSLFDYRATTVNIIERLKWVVDHKNSEIVIQYSGHGSYVRDRNGDELDDGQDEIWCPYDMDWDNPLTDDMIGDILDGLPDSSFLTFISDSCHSGTITRNINKNNHARFLNPPRDIRFRSDSKVLPVRKIGARAAELNHILITGCRDNQTSADARFKDENGNYIWRGAMTYNLLNTMNTAKTWADIQPDLIKQVKAGGFQQDPDISGREFNTRRIFGM